MLPPEVEELLLLEVEVEVLLPPLEVLLLFLHLENFDDLNDFEKNDLLKFDLEKLVFQKKPDPELFEKKAFASVGVTAAAEVVATAAVTIAALMSFRYGMSYPLSGCACAITRSGFGKARDMPLSSEPMTSEEHKG